MKKLTFLLVTLLIGGMMFTGCKKIDPTPEPTPVDPETNPTLTLQTGENYLAEGMEVTAYENFRLGLICDGENLKTLQINFKKGEELVYELTETFDESTNHSELDRTYNIETAGNITMTAVLTDAKDKTATVTVNFKVLENVPMLFAGSYEGYLVIEAIGNIPGMGESQMPADSIMCKLDVLINEDGETAVVTLTQPEGDPWVINATFEGETLVCEPYTETTVAGGVMTLNVIYTFKGTRVDNILRIDGIVEGSGTVVQQGVELPISLNGTIIGDMDKVE